ncbi:hypothetical protein [Fluviispira multicolorata]|uniref:Uncharacterized protein n=1 Tax=Fluviispira multicolorata TaxID=2654512 RepID=A0A833JEG9_9BACT|nr:hypothetical protein [Fluviispira multicolorata]KAB8031894.1 hypothetical protein GCL57_04420 [Fluviispira multicolorata]
MKKYVCCLIPMMSFSLLPTLSYADAYLLCVNSNNHDDWEWAPPITEMEHARWGRGNKFIPINEKGTLISGSIAWNKYLHLVLDTKVNKENFTIDKVRSFCDELKRQCLKLGPQYNLIGAANKFIPSLDKSYISFTYFVSTTEDNGYYSEIVRKEKSTTCPNWTYPDFPNDGGTLSIFDS